MSRNRRAVVLAMVLVYAAGFRLAVLDRPFEYNAEGSGSLNGVLARSYLRFGWSATRGMPVLSTIPVPRRPIVAYPDHPPLVPLLIVPFYAAFGVGAWQTRLPVAVLTLGAIVVLYGLLAGAAGPRVGLTAAGVFAATPMTLYFGGFPDVVGMPLIFCVLLALAAYVRFHRAPGRRTFVPFAAAFLLAGFCDWPAYVIVPILAVHFIATHERRDWPWMAAFGVVSCAWFAALYTYITLATRSPWTWIVPLFSRRSAFAGGAGFTWWQWVERAAALNRTYHTLVLLACAAVWLMAFGWRIRRAEPGATVARLLLAWAAAYIAIGGKALYDHEWAWLPLTPGIAAATALLVERALRAADRRSLATLAPAAAVVAVAFASWTAHAAAARLRVSDDAFAFTPMDLALAIRAAAPAPSDVALLVGSDEREAQLWFYGDRPLRTGVWSIADLERRVDDATVDLLYGFDEQPWPAAATGLVLPRCWGRQLITFRTYLAEHYRLVPLPTSVSDKFEVYDLRTPRSAR